MLLRPIMTTECSNKLHQLAANAQTWTRRLTEPKTHRTATVVFFDVDLSLCVVILTIKMNRLFVNKSLKREREKERKGWVGGGSEKSNRRKTINFYDVTNTMLALDHYGCDGGELKRRQMGRSRGGRGGDIGGRRQPLHQDEQSVLYAS